MSTMYPTLLELLKDERERTKFVAFASSTYEQEEVLFLASLLEFEQTSDKGSHWQYVTKEYLCEGAPHAVRGVSANTRKQFEKRAKQGKHDQKLVDLAWKEVEKDLPVYQRYEERWLKELKVDMARRQLIREIEFDLSNPPALSQLLKQPTFVRQLRLFAESIFCEEIVSFYAEALEWKQKCDLEQGRKLVEKYISVDAVMCLNLEHDTRDQVVQAFEKGEISPDVFEGVLYAVCHQMQQNLYFQFLAHLKAIHKELATQSILLRLSAQPEEVKSEDAKFVEPKFEEVMQDPIQLQNLLGFAGRMYSQERVVFYVLLQDFKAQTNETVKRRMAEKIFSEYIVEGSKRQVSFEGRRYIQITEAYAAVKDKDIPTNFFDAVEKEILRSIRHEVFDRFVDECKSEWESEIAAARKKSRGGVSPPPGKKKLGFFKKISK